MNTSLFILLALVGLSSAYPSGAPVSRCGDMTPVHYGAAPQNTMAPYNITLSATSYTAGQNVSVTIHSTDTNSSLAFFRGLIVEVRRASCLENQDEAIGSFVLMPSETQLQLITCNAVAQSGVTHNTNAQKTSKTFHWVAPANSTGHVRVRATLVRTAYVFWTNIHSAVIKDPSAPSLPTPAECGVTSDTTASHMTTPGMITMPPKKTTTESSANHVTLSTVFFSVVALNVFSLF